jgi:glycosyltransferase involved in cell wall biosynthesis
MKSLLFFIPRLYLGGAETQFRQLIDNLKSDYKLDVFLIYNSDFDNDFIQKNENISFRYLGINKKDTYRNSSLRVFLYIINYIFIYFQLFFILLIKRYNLVISYGEVLAPFLPIFKFFRTKILFSVRTATKKLLNRKYIKFFLSLSDVLTCNSPVTKDMLSEIGIKKVHVILNGFNIPDERMDFIVPQSIKNIVNIARISPDKNQLVLLKALKQIPNKKILFIGRIVDDNYYKTLLDYIKSNHLENHVEFYGYTSSIQQVYQKADIIALPSYEEGLANVILESFYWGKYCIASNIEANNYILKGHGGLFSPDDWKTFVDKVIEYEELSIQKKKEIAITNYNYLKSEFSLDKVVKQYIEIIENYA